MKRLKAFIAAIVTDSRELAIPQAPEHFALAPGQAKTLEEYGIHKIHVTYREGHGHFPRASWTGGESAVFLHPFLRDLPKEPLLVIRRNFGDFEIRAGLAYHDMPAQDVQMIIGSLLDGAVDSVIHGRRLNALQHTADKNSDRRNTVPEMA